jgi:hypothetical protein
MTPEEEQEAERVLAELANHGWPENFEAFFNIRLGKYTRFRNCGPNPMAVYVHERDRVGTLGPLHAPWCVASLGPHQEIKLQSPVPKDARIVVLEAESS